MSKVSYRWKPIEDLPKELMSFHQPGLMELASIWRDHATRLQKVEAVRDFNERLCREWAIETGIIEGLYAIDRGVTQLLIERGLDASLIPHGSTDRPASEIVPILQAQRDTLDGLFDFVLQRRQLSVSYIKELHQSLTQHQEFVDAIDQFNRPLKVPLIRGDWKQSPNNPTKSDGTIHEYCPHEHVASEMDRLVTLHLQHSAAAVAPEVESAWLHHRFTQIHPFQDGNGRVARALASLVLLRAGWFPLVINRDFRDLYIDSLEAADAGDLKLLIDIVGKTQKDAFVRALSVAEDTLRRTEPLDQVISRASAKIRERKFAEYQDMQHEAIARANELLKHSETVLKKLSEKVASELKELDPSYGCFVTTSSQSNDFWFKRQIVEIARRLKYFADTRSYRSWVRLRIREERQTDLVITFHGLGQRFLGVMAASAFLLHRDVADAEGAIPEGPYPLAQEVFQFAYQETPQALRARFDKWLGEVTIAGMSLWQRQL